ncbi:MAG TPA: YdcF family protein [Hyphomicrobium sp.]|nr:YdcF family protein [Hyphomicrobium sp.]
MYHPIAKVLWFSLQPSSLILILLITGAALLFTRHWRAGRRLVVASGALFLIGGMPPLGNVLILPLEQRFARADLSGRDVDGIIVLGGVEDARVAAGRHVHAMNEAGERITEAAALALRYPRAKVLFTSGSVGYGGAHAAGADGADLIFRDLGIADDRLLPERASHNTWENAVYTKALAAPQPGQRWLLVTSASHMPRAMGVFRKVGFAVEPWPVDFRTADARDWFQTFESPAEGLRRVELAVHEWIGLITYWLMGRSDELFPRP